MHVKTTGMAHMNMDIWLDSVQPANDGEREALVLEMNVRRPRVWHVVARVSGEDVRNFLRLVLLNPSVLLCALHLVFQRTSPDSETNDEPGTNQ
jgi:hypothetical protein